MSQMLTDRGNFTLQTNKMLLTGTVTVQVIHISTANSSQTVLEKTLLSPRNGRLPTNRRLRGLRLTHLQLILAHILKVKVKVTPISTVNIPQTG